MAEIHNVTQFGNSIHFEESKTFDCVVCESVFKRKENLKAHEKTHLESSSNKNEMKVWILSKLFVDSHPPP